jgi:type III secretion protein N (ATPase)
MEIKINENYIRYGTQVSGKVIRISPPYITINTPLAQIGVQFLISSHVNKKKIAGTVIKIEQTSATLVVESEIEEISIGAEAISNFSAATIPMPITLLGRVIDSRGINLQEQEEKKLQTNFVPLYRGHISPLSRSEVEQPFKTNCKAIDLLTPLGYGQRVAVIAPAGVGKTTLLLKLAKEGEFDCLVIGLVGERGREVVAALNELEKNKTFKRSLIIATTSDDSPAKRAQAPHTATCYAEELREKGMKVLLLVDSITRYARAVRDLSFSKGELPVRGGLTASVYSELPKLIERAGCNKSGSITAIYTLLGSEDGVEDPLVEEVKSLVDGHITMTRELFYEGILPAIDPLKSLSRLEDKVSSAADVATIRSIKKIWGEIRRAKEILLLGGALSAKSQEMLKFEPLLTKLIYSQDITCQASKEKFNELAAMFRE